MANKRICANKKAISDEGWNEIHDCLTLALDQHETGRNDFQGTRDLVRHLRPALKVAHRRLEVLR